VGFLTFSDAVSNQVPVAPLAENRFKIVDAIQNTKVQYPTALYDGIKAGIQMSDTAEGVPEAIRAVVVLTDGHASQGQTKLDDLIRMTSPQEVSLEHFGGMENENFGLDSLGNQVPRQDISGIRLAMPTHHPVQVFFIGIGEDADIEVGRILSEATGAEFQGVAEQDLARVIEEFGKYF
jgi:hypothetical protein